MNTTSLFRLFQILFFVVILSATNLIAQVFEADSLALVRFYQDTNGPAWTNNTNWLSGPVSSWYGIQTSNNRITYLNLQSNKLSGTIPTEICDLDSLLYFDLRWNEIGGTIPNDIGNLKKLTFFGLMSNQITGEIPESAGALTKLTGFMVGWNQLNGEILPAICNLTDLTNLNLSNNQFTGPIPEQIGNLVNLTIITLENNQLTGAIPHSIGNIAGLNALYAYGNMLSGQIPAEIGNLKNLTRLDLKMNELTGVIPLEIGKLENLSMLNIYQNQITGSIPREIGKLPNLTQLNLSSNMLSGEIPGELGNLTLLTQLDLRDNQLSGSIPKDICKLTNLTNLYFDQNQFAGDIPAEITNLNQLQWLGLWSNHFSGLPDLSKIATLQRLQVGQNMFTFEDIEPNIGIPTFSYSPQDSVGKKETRAVEMGSNVTLSVDVGGSQNQYQWYRDFGLELSGATKPEYIIESAGLDDQGNYICKITNTLATELTLYSRPINLVIDETFSLERDSLALVSLYNSTNGSNWTNSTNWLTGPVATWFGITVENERVIEINLHDNNLTGAIPPEIGDMTQLYNINLSSNHLSGEIPPEIGNLYTMYNLFLAGNQLSGSLPSEIRRLKKLTSIYIGYNKIADLPNLSSMTALEQLFIEGNKLTFEDIEPNINIPQFTYSNQDSVGVKQDTVLQLGANLTLDVSVGGTQNHYQWMKDNVDIPTAQSPSYTITFTDPSILGVYLCKVTNTIATDLILYSRPISVRDTTQVKVAQEKMPIPKAFALYQNYPNPFNPFTVISFDIPVAGYVQIAVYNLNGQKVKTLKEEMIEPGQHSIAFHGKDDAGRKLASGIYLYIMEANDFKTCKKLTYLK